MKFSATLYCTSVYIACLKALHAIAIIWIFFTSERTDLLSHWKHQSHWDSLIYRMVTLNQSKQIKGRSFSVNYTLLITEKFPLYYACMHAVASVVSLETPWIVVHQAPLPMGLSRQKYWSGLPCPPLGGLLDPGTEPMSFVSGIGR